MAGVETRVLLLGYNGFGGVRGLAKVAKSRGFEPIAVVNADCPERFTSDCTDVVRCQDIFRARSVEEAIVDRFGTRRFAGLCSGFDYLTLVYLELLEKLDVPRPASLLAILMCRIKPALRSLLAARSDFKVPCIVIREYGDYSSVGKTIGFPCVAKPIFGAGSLGVRRCATEEELQRYVEELRGRLKKLRIFQTDAPISVNSETYDITSDVLVEAELFGPELTCDGYIRDGKATVTLFQDMVDTRDERDFLDVGFINPPVRVDPAGLEEVRVMLEEVFALLRCTEFVFHAEVKFTPNGPRIVEINPRPGGGPIAKMIQYRRGCSPLDIFFEFSLGGLNLEVPPPTGPPFLGYFTLFADRPGNLDRITGLDEVSKLPSFLEAINALEPGEPVVPFVDKRYLTFVLLKGDSPQEIFSGLRYAAARLNFVLEQES